MRVIRSRVIVRGAKSPLSCAESCVHQVRSSLVVAAQHASRKSGAIYESGAKYKLRKFRAMNFFEVSRQTLW
jgi:hypothetical protein